MIVVAWMETYFFPNATKLKCIKILEAWKKKKETIKWHSQIAEFARFVPREYSRKASPGRPALII